MTVLVFSSQHNRTTIEQQKATRLYAPIHRYQECLQQILAYPGSIVYVLAAGLLFPLCKKNFDTVNFLVIKSYKIAEVLLKDVRLLALTTVLYV